MYREDVAASKVVAGIGAWRVKRDDNDKVRVEWHEQPSQAEAEAVNDALGAACYHVYEKPRAVSPDVPKGTRVTDYASTGDLQGKGFAVTRVTCVEGDKGMTAQVTWRSLPNADVITQAEQFLGQYVRISHGV